MSPPTLSEARSASTGSRASASSRTGGLPARPHLLRTPASPSGPGTIACPGAWRTGARRARATSAGGGLEVPDLPVDGVLQPGRSPARGEPAVGRGGSGLVGILREERVVDVRRQGVDVGGEHDDPGPGIRDAAGAGTGERVPPQRVGQFPVEVSSSRRAATRTSPSLRTRARRCASAGRRGRGRAWPWRGGRRPSGRCPG